jgi:hypothetical protein
MFARHDGVCMHVQVFIGVPSSLDEIETFDRSEAPPSPLDDPDASPSATAKRVSSVAKNSKMPRSQSQEAEAVDKEAVHKEAADAQTLPTENSGVDSAEAHAEVDQGASHRNSVRFSLTNTNNRGSNGNQDVKRTKSRAVGMQDESAKGWAYAQDRRRQSNIASGEAGPIRTFKKIFKYSSSISEETVQKGVRAHDADASGGGPLGGRSEQEEHTSQTYETSPINRQRRVLANNKTTYSQPRILVEAQEHNDVVVSTGSRSGKALGRDSQVWMMAKEGTVRKSSQATGRDSSMLGRASTTETNQVTLPAIHRREGTQRESISVADDSMSRRSSVMRPRISRASVLVSSVQGANQEEPRANGEEHWKVRARTCASTLVCLCICIQFALHFHVHV